MTSSDCLFCLLHPEYNIVKLLFPLKFCCPHRKLNFSPKPHLETNLTLMVFNIFLLIIFICATFSCFPQIFMVCKNEQSTCIMFIADLLVLVGSIILGILIGSQVVMHKQELNSWLYLFENHNLFNLEKLIDNKVRRKFLIYNYAVVVALLLACLNAVEWCIFSYDNFQWSSLRRSALTVLFFYHSLGFLEFAERILIVGVILRAFEAQLLRTRSLLVQRLKLYQQLVSFLSDTVSLLSKSMSVLITLWIMVMTASIIINIFILLKFGEYNNIDMLFRNLRTGVTIAAIINVFVNCEKEINNKTDDILSLLFRYPISKMTLMEATQVEVLISTMIIQKPVLRASHIFTVGTRLLASISGTVVTYVLVALQFRASWAK